MSNKWWPDSAAYSEFLSPSLIVGGRGSSANAAELLSSRFGIAGGSILVAVDSIVLQNGLAEPMLASLREAGFNLVTSSGFGSEPTSEVVDAAAEAARRAEVRAIIGIGGGSVLDSSKLLALMVRNEGDAKDWLGAVVPPNGLLPMLLVPTTCGTGSEATRIAMVTVDGAKRASSCAGYVPDVVIIDPDLLATLPGPVVASTAMDALSHAVESLMSTSRSPMSSHHALRAIEFLVANIEKASQGDQDALAECLWGSHFAGQALNAGVVLGHSLAYCLAYEHPMAHGTSCALALPYCIAYNQNLDPTFSGTLARALTAGDTTDLRSAAQAVMELSRRLGLPVTLDDVQIAPNAEAAIAARVVAEYPRPTNPEALDETRLEQLLISMRNGDLDTAFDVTLAGATR